MPLSISPLFTDKVGSSEAPKIRHMGDFSPNAYGRSLRSGESSLLAQILDILCFLKRSKIFRGFFFCYLIVPKIPAEHTSHPNGHAPVAPIAPFEHRAEVRIGINYIAEEALGWLFLPKGCGYRAYATIKLIAIKILREGSFEKGSGVLRLWHDAKAKPDHIRHVIARSPFEKAYLYSIRLFPQSAVFFEVYASMQMLVDENMEQLWHRELSKGRLGQYDVPSLPNAIGKLGGHSLRRYYARLRDDRFAGNAEKYIQLLGNIAPIRANVLHNESAISPLTDLTFHILRYIDSGVKLRPSPGGALETLAHVGNKLIPTF